MPTALVTGASSGIGLAFARHLAARGDDLVLVARDEQRLQALADDLTATFEVSCEVLRADLATDEGIAAVAARLEDPSRPVELFVNNAGFGLHANLLNPDAEETARALKVMCYAVVMLGAAAARTMEQRGRGTIINTGSTAGWLATGLYSAVKAFVNNYSESLAVALHGSGVHVTNLAPGWVKTEFHSRAGIHSSNLPEAVWIDVDVLVDEALADADKGRVWSVPTKRWSAAGVVANHVPRGAVRWFSRKLNSSRKK